MNGDQVTIGRFIFREAMCSLILGSLPCVLIILDGGVEALNLFLKRLMPTSIIFRFLVSLVIVHIISWWYVNNRRRKQNNIVGRGILKLYEITDQIGFSLLGVYRVIAGVLPVVTLAAFFVEPSAEYLRLVLLYSFVALCIIYMCCILSVWKSRTSIND